MIVTSDMMTKMIVTKIMMKTMTEMMTVIAVRSLAQVAGIYFEVSAIHQNFPCDDDDGDDDDDDVEDNDDDDDNDVEDDNDDNMLKSGPKVGVVHKNNKVCKINLVYDLFPKHICSFMIFCQNIIVIL